MPDSEHRQMFIVGLLRLLEEHAKNAFDLSFSLAAINYQRTFVDLFCQIYGDVGEEQYPPFCGDN